MKNDLDNVLCELCYNISWKN